MRTACPTYLQSWSVWDSWQQPGDAGPAHVPTHHSLPQAHVHPVSHHRDPNPCICLSLPLSPAEHVQCPPRDSRRIQPHNVMPCSAQGHPVLFHLAPLVAPLSATGELVSLSSMWAGGASHLVAIYDHQKTNHLSHGEDAYRRGDAWRHLSFSLH